jgi:lysozyme family protein
VTVWQTQAWWVQHYNSIIFISGGWYAWDQGYWIPAWGYDSASVYYYDEPTYAPVACQGLDQVVANVQSALQAQGYYQGEIDGVLGPDTQAALSAYQQAQGLEDTGAVDEPTVESLGLA